MKLTRQLSTLAGCLAAYLLSPGTMAQPTSSPEEVLLALINETGSSYLTQSEQNLMMMADSPAYWTVEDGADLFYTERGPNNVTLEGCRQSNGN